MEKQQRINLIVGMVFWSTIAFLIYFLVLHFNVDRSHRAPYSSVFEHAVRVQMRTPDQIREWRNNGMYSPSAGDPDRKTSIHLLRSRNEIENGLSCSDLELRSRRDWYDKYRTQDVTGPTFGQWEAQTVTWGISRHPIFDRIPLQPTKISLAIIGDFDLSEIFQEKANKLNDRTRRLMTDKSSKNYHDWLNGYIADLRFDVLDKQTCDGFVIYNLEAW